MPLASNAGKLHNIALYITENVIVSWNKPFYLIEEESIKKKCEQTLYSAYQ